MYLSINMFPLSLNIFLRNIFIDKYISINDNDKTIIAKYNSINFGIR